MSAQGGHGRSVVEVVLWACGFGLLMGLLLMVLIGAARATSPDAGYWSKWRYNSDLQTCVGQPTTAQWAECLNSAAERYQRRLDGQRREERR